jgi:hypothetical protein
LQELVMTWSSLPEAIKAAVSTLVRAASHPLTITANTADEIS